MPESLPFLYEDWQRPGSAAILAAKLVERACSDVSILA